jgi:tetratricopeptide (TPR) repeat protein
MSRTALCLVALLAGASAARAQCPDGTPPPCRAATPSPASLPLDTNAVAVLPFAVEGPGASFAWLSTGMVDVLSGALDGVGGWRTVSPRTVLARIPRAGLDVPRGAQAARALGAGQMVIGSAVAVGRTVRLRAELYSTVSRQRLGLPVEARASLDDPAAAMDSLAVGLSRLRLGARGAGRTADLVTASPQVLRTWLAAEDLMRGGRFQAAADSLLSAIARDSSFAPAYYRLHIASTFSANIEPWTGLRALRAALRNPERLATRQRDLLRAALAGLEGRRFQALELGTQVGARYADDAEAAYVEGEAYFHFGLDLGEPPARALQAFERGIALDSTLIDNYNHAVELRYRLGNLDGARALLRQGLALQPDHFILHSIALVDRVASGEPPAQILRETRLSRRDPEPIIARSFIEALRCLADDPARALEVGMLIARQMQGADSPRPARALALRNEAAVLFARGQRRAAGDALEAAEALEGGTGRNLAIEFALVARRGADWPASFVPSDPEVPVVIEGLEGVRRGLARLAARDTAAARAELLAAYPVRPSTNGTIPGALGALAIGSSMLARLDLAAGSARTAWQHAQDDLFLSGTVTLRAEAEELRGMIAERLGDREAAVRGYRNFAALWAQADPELQPRVQAAREALARLGAAP